jgi:asparagine synthase (glutamine-hydrolysing)
MGAICGIVIPDNHEKALEAGPKIFEKLKIYEFDKTGDMNDPGVYFGCGLTYNTPESLFEQLPRKNEDSRYMITADAIIDNRTELFTIFQIDPNDFSTITDSELILRAYEKWGYSCTKYLIGDYAFAIWDLNKKELYCARDPVGTRTLYYTCEQGIFAFCTIEKPLLGITSKAELNEKWLADFLAINGVQHELLFDETVYRGIYQLPPAFYGIVTAQGFKQTQYWDPLKDVQPIRFETDEEYVEAFNKIFSEAVSCRTRSAGETGMMLSGGMDSGSIACVAAKQMLDTNRNLLAFCSVPSENFNEKPGKRSVYNETPEVELIVNAFQNIDITYCSFEGKNSLTDIDDLLSIFEQPYKIYQNMTWYHPMLKLAATNNCKIMLNGQVGNSTISYGDFRVHLLTLFRAGKWISCFNEITALSLLLDVPAKKVFKLAIKVIIPFRIRKWRDQIRNKDFDRFQDVIVNKSLIDKWDVEERLDQAEANLLTSPFHDYEEERVRRASPMPFIHIGAVETKLCLANRITIRDPSRDKRVLEFCLSIPSNQFVKDGNERYLLRRATKGILPDRIRNNNTTRGVQSPDWIQRLTLEWDRLCAEVDQVLATKEIEPYVDMNKIKDLREKLDHNPETQDANTLRMVLVTIIMSRFINDFKQNYTN